MSIGIRKPQPSDAAPTKALIERCPPLDVNSVYCYMLLYEHFGETCAVATSGEKLVGFVTGYVPPQQRETLFIWQVAVDGSARGMGLAKRMILEILGRDDGREIGFLEATVGASNKASLRLFESLARELGGEIASRELFGAELFGGESHEAEDLYRIGPFSKRKEA